MESLYRYRFGTVEFDEARFELRVAGLPVDLQRRPLEVLQLLLHRAGEVVSRDELLRVIWEGRPTVEGVVANALAKLRTAVGADNAAYIVTQARIGYRLAASVERVVVGRQLATVLELQAGQAVPRRENFLLESQLSRSDGGEVWLARQVRTGEPRVYKFSGTGEELSALKREAMLSRVLGEAPGTRDRFVRIIDWNFESAPMFLECEYGGQDLLQWAESGARLASMEQSERLLLLQQLADAVAMAHGLGVLHKDLKPANILLAPRGQGWLLRLADFGSGRLLEPDRLAGLGITLAGMTVTQIGNDGSGGATPLYFAPEVLAGQPATARSDVYALGLILYQVLAGDLRRPMAPGWERDIGDELLREDIAAATDVDPARRLDSAAELAGRLRFLAQRRAVRDREEAERQAARLRDEMLRRARTRRPWLVTVVALLCLGLGVTSVLYWRLRSTQSAVQRQYAVARALNDFLIRDFIALANPLVAGRRNVTVIETAHRAAGDIDIAFRGTDPQIRGALHAAMQEALFGLSEFDGSMVEGGKALAALESVRPLDSAALADVRTTLAEALTDRSRWDESEKQLDAVAQLLRIQGVATPSRQARYLAARAGVELEHQDSERSVKDYAVAWRLAAADSTMSPDLRDDIQFEYADALKLTSQFQEADQQALQLLARSRARFGAEHPLTCFAEVLHASILGYMDREQEGAPVARMAADCLLRTLGPSALRTASAYTVLADLQFKLDQYADAALAYDAVARSLAMSAGVRSVRYINARMNAAVSRQYAGQLRSGMAGLSEALEAAQAAFGWTASITQDLRYHLADCRLDLHDTATVAHLLAGLEVTSLNQAQIEPDWDGRLAYQRGRLAFYTGDRGTARSLLQQALDIIGAKNPDGHVSANAVRTLLQQVGDASLH